MLEFLRLRARSIGYALEGWWHVLRTQRNTWIHTLISLAVVGVGLWLGLPPRDWAILVLTMGLVWIAEFFNTAIEALTDLASPQYNHLAKISKDVGAAAVLIAAGTAILIGLLILGPPLWGRLFGENQWISINSVLAP
jgi:diacylglycerol kinase (ATP)